MSAQRCLKSGVPRGGKKVALEKKRRKSKYTIVSIRGQGEEKGGYPHPDLYSSTLPSLRRFYDLPPLAAPKKLAPLGPSKNHVFVSFPKMFTFKQKKRKIQLFEAIFQKVPSPYPQPILTISSLSETEFLHPPHPKNILGPVDLISPTYDLEAHLS